MRTIRKGTGGYDLNQKHQNPPQTSSDARRRWSSFRKTDYSLVCFNEQLGLCGYSEISIGNHFAIFDDHSPLTIDIGSHIEHIQPKSKRPQKTFSHQNLILSAFGSESLRKYRKEDVFGGHYKQDNYSNGFISPVMLDCAEKFHYEISGKIVPKINQSKREQAKARLTIYMLNLNSPYLVDLRRIWITQLNDEIDNAQNDLDLKEIAEFELLPINGRLKPFYSAQKQMLGDVGNLVELSAGL